MAYALFYFAVNFILNEVDYFSKRLPLWYCFKCFVFWGCLGISLLSGSSIIESIGLAGLLSFFTTLYDRGL